METKQTTRQCVIALFAAHPGLEIRPRRLADTIGRSYHATYQTLLHLHRRGLVVRCGYGRKAWRWFRPEGV